jgi:peptidoglycan hydrolase CwlO-like protein
MEDSTVISLIALGISIILAVITIVSFFLGRKDKSNKDTKDDSYKWGQFDTKLDNIEKTLAKIENKLDSYDREVEEKIDDAMKHHINEYHKN